MPKRQPSLSKRSQPTNGSDTRCQFATSNQNNDPSKLATCQVSIRRSRIITTDTQPYPVFNSTRHPTTCPSKFNPETPKRVAAAVITQVKLHFLSHIFRVDFNLVLYIFFSKKNLSLIFSQFFTFGLKSTFRIQYDFAYRQSQLDK